MDDQRKQVMMSIPEDEFGNQVLMTLLRQLVEGQTETNKQLHAMNDTHTQVRERLTALEQNPVADLAKRVIILEAEALRNQGAKNLIIWVKDFTPWIITILFGAFAYFTKNPPPHVQ